MPRRRRPVEPLLWLLFSAGGVMSALFLPVLMVVFALAVPLGWIDDPGREGLLALAANPLTGLVLIGVCALSLFHWAQRFRYTLFDGLQLKHHQLTINAVVYVLALLGSVAAVVLVGEVVLTN